MKGKVIEIEDYNGNTIMSFIIDRNGNIKNEINCSIADKDYDYIYNSDLELIRVQEINNERKVNKNEE